MRITKPEKWPAPRHVYVLMDENGNPDRVTHIAPEQLWPGAEFRTYRLVPKRGRQPR